MADGDMSIEDAYRAIEKKHSEKINPNEFKNDEGRSGTDEPENDESVKAGQLAIVMDRFAEFKQAIENLNRPVLNQFIIKVEKHLNKLTKQATKS